MCISPLKLLPALVLASKAVLSAGVIVEASNVTNVEVTASDWDLRAEADGGCGVGGCDPRLTRDGQDNTVTDSRWSCELYCAITFTFDTSFDISYIILYFHESDEDTEVSIPFTVNSDTDDLTLPGTPLGEGQQVNLPAGEYSDEVIISFEITNDQWIHLSEVEIFLDVDDPDDIVVSPSTKYIVNLKTVANMYMYASNWDLSGDAGCGEAGCDPRLASDGENNTVAGSRWSCSLTADTDGLWWSDEWDALSCRLGIDFDSYLTISHIIVYMHESDDTAKAPMFMEVMQGSCTIWGCSSSDSLNSFETVPGTPLGVGQRVNLARPSLSGIIIAPNATLEGQSVAISEVEVFVEVTKTDVGVAAREAWNVVTAETVTTVTPSATGSVEGFGPGMATDGDNNTVATSYWSCNLTAVELTSLFDSCALSFEFGDEYPVSHIVLYVHESNDDTSNPIHFVVYKCLVVGSGCYADDQIGTHSTIPGTALGEEERFNLIRPYTSKIGIWFNMTGRETIDISEVEIFLEVPDGTPTPSPFATPAPTDPPVYSWSADDDDSSSTSIINDDAGSGLANDDSSTTTIPNDDTASGLAGDDSSSMTANYNYAGSDDDSFTTTTPIVGSTLPPELSTDSISGSEGTKPALDVFTAFGVAMSLLLFTFRAIPLF